MQGEFAYTKDGQIFVPNHEITAPMPEHEYEPLRGYGYTLAVFQRGECVGWTTVATLGFNSVSEWVQGKND